MFKVTIEWNDKAEEIELEEGKSRILGRSKEYAQFVIDDARISRRHCLLSLENNNLYIQDLGSANGTYVNAQKIEPNIRVRVTPEDSIQLTRAGLVRIKLSAYEEHFETGERKIYIDRDLLTIGRTEDNDIVIPLPTISRHHARITREDDKVFIEDLNSTNGTFVDGKKITDKALLTPGVQISLGSYNLKLETRNKLTGTSFYSSLELLGVGLSYSVVDKCLVDNVNIYAMGGELIAIIGPAGCGKTTLLNMLAGLLPESEGNVFINGEELYENYDRLSVNIGYVPQDDIVHRELTVYQSIYYTAWLRLPADTTKEERLKAVEDVLNELKLTEVRNVIVGYPGKKGISGGQRKKVNMAQEWITKPSIIFLDEPGTGLDPYGYREVMELLRKCADDGKIVLTITHNIENEADALYFDKILVLARGKQIYFGPPREMFSFFGKDCVSKIFMELEQPSDVDKWQKKFLASGLARNLKQKIGGHSYTPGDKNLSDTAKRISFTTQFNALFSRNITRKISDRAQTLFLLLQAPIIGLIISQLYTNLNIVVLLLMVMSGIWFGLINSIREIIGERAIYQRERRANVKILPYLLSKFTVLGLLAFSQTIMLLLFVGLSVREIWGIFPLLSVLVFLSIMVSIGFGLLISSIVNTQESAIAIMPIVIIVELIFAGGIKPLSEFSSVLKGIAHLIPSKWAMEGAVNIAKESLKISPAYIGFQTNLAIDFVFLAGFIVFFSLLIMIFLKMKER